MSTKSAKAPVTNSESTVDVPVAKRFAPPKGMTKTTGDVMGFANVEEFPIYGIPRAAKLSDSKIDPRKVSCFVIFELLEPVNVYSSDEGEGEVLTAPKGAMVGVWTKPGMRAIAKQAGVPVWMAHSGEKEVHKGKPGMNAMKTYDIHIGEGKGTLIPVIEDNRDKSATETHFLLKGSNAGRPDDANLPF